ncbi:MAG: DUF2304 domain-containing protein [Candidatus Berkelbacteria bacterium]
MILITKIVAICLAVTVIAKTYLAFKKKEESFIMFIFWTATWLSIIFVAVYPIIIDKIGSLIGDSRNSVIAFFGLAFVFILFVTYRIYVKANKIEKQLCKIIIDSAKDKV